MTGDRPAAGAAILAAAVAALLCVFLLAVRPWYLHWGATDGERARVLPGDEIVPGATGQQTRAITIQAPVDRVWPWLAQVGQDRGGFYSFDLLENLVGCEMPTTDLLRPDRQAWEIGHKLWMYPSTKAGGMGSASLRAYVPERVLGFGTHLVGTPASAPENGSWSFVLEPIDQNSTRFLVRGRANASGRSWVGTAFDRAIFEPVHFVMERRMMIGLKQLAEGSDRSRGSNHVLVGLWTLTGLLLVFAAFQLLRRHDWRRPLVAFVTAAVVFQVLTLAQPPVLLGAALTALVAALVFLKHTGDEHAYFA